MRVRHGTRFSRRRFLQVGSAAFGAIAFIGLATASDSRAEADRLRRTLSKLIAAIKRGDIGSVRAILDERPALAGTVDDAGRSLFLLAHLHNQQDVANAIKEQLEELDFVETIADGDYDRIKAMASGQRKQINAAHPVGGTAYFAAARFGRARAMWPLNRNGGDPNAQPLGPDTMSPVRAAFECPDPQLAAAAALRMLTDAGDPTVPQPNGDTILHAAARLGDLDVLRTVLRKGGDPDARNAAGETPLDVARSAGHGEARELLENPGVISRLVTTSRFAHVAGGDRYVRREVDVPQATVDEFGEVAHFNFDRVKALVTEHPEIVHANATWNELGVEASAHMGRRDMTDYLLDKGAPLSLPTALMIRNGDLVRRMLRADADRIHERGAHDFALMWYPGIGGESVGMAELLLEFGADVDEEKFGATLLHRASLNGYIDLVHFLLEQGANVNAVGRSDFSDLSGTPIDWAASQGREDIVKLLESRGGEPAR